MNLRPAILTALAAVCTSYAGDRWRTEPREIPDVEVLDQNGSKLHFYSDLVKDRVVAIQFVFTTCRTICPALAATFKHLQDLTAGSPSIRLISISVDPEQDRPEVLHKFAAEWNVKPGWSLITGDRAAMDKLRKTFGDTSTDKAAHSPMVWIGSGPRARAVRATRPKPVSTSAAFAGS